MSTCAGVAPNVSPARACGLHLGASHSARPHAHLETLHPVGCTQAGREVGVGVEFSSPKPDEVCVQGGWGVLDHLMPRPGTFLTLSSSQKPEGVLEGARAHSSEFKTTQLG